MRAEYITPAITVLQEDGHADFTNLKRLYDHLIDGGINGILVLGSIGEFFAISYEEKKEIIRFAVDTVAGRTKVLVGTTSMVPGETMALSNYALECGADGVVIVPPYYFSLTQESIYDFYAEIAEAVSGPIYIYNFPDRTGYEIAAETIRRLAEKYPNIAGCKDTIPGVAHTREIIKAVKPVRPDFKVYSGFDDNFAYNVLSGGDGCIGGLSNLLPGFFQKWVDAFARDDLAEIMQRQQAVNRLMDIYNVGAPFVPYIKNAMKALGVIDCDKASFPLPKATTEDSEKILEIVNKEREWL